MNNTAQFSFSDALLSWFDIHGRKQLPWQHPITPYRVWLSEVMLQQTQVDTVIPYFERFLTSFPTIEALAEADLDKVLHLWTGLGYYARARNLHKCAGIVAEEYKGDFPGDPESLIALPGIGKSTAHAITSIAFGQPTAIMDGNVKRVLARYHQVEGWPGTPKIETQLWHFAEQHMPNLRCGDYTQAIMDLGATLCKRSKPNCSECPMNQHCNAYKNGLTAELPNKKPKKAIPTKSTTMLIAQDPQGRLLINQRPPQGIWGGLWSFLEFEDESEALKHGQSLGDVTHKESWSSIRHVFSHYKLDIHPLIAQITPASSINENQQQWVTLEDALALGLSAPVKRLIETLKQQSTSLI